MFVCMLKRRRPSPDWNRLHSNLRDVYASAGAGRMTAVVDNHGDKKETICRRLGVISPADLSRIAAGLKRSKIRESGS